MIRVSFDAADVLQKSGTEYPGVQSAGALVDQVKHITDVLNVHLTDLFPDRIVQLDCRRLGTDPAGLKFEIEIRRERF